MIGLLGPTGVGKTAVAVELAGIMGCRIISCDSMQVYAGFPVLTNQPWRAEERPELHDLVGFLDAGDTMSAGGYAALAGPLLERSIDECGRALVVGGSGLYMRAALAPLAAPGPADQELRLRLKRRAEEEGPDVLHAELVELDPAAAAEIDPRNLRRVMRALEGVLSHGRRWSGRDDLWQPAYPRPTTVFGLWAERDVLASRIEARTTSMLVEGAVEEVESFRAHQDAEGSRPGSAGICSAIGYAEISEYLAGRLTREEAHERMAAATRRYARRQGTWLRRVRDAVMIESEGRDARDIARLIADSAQIAG